MGRAKAKMFGQKRVNTGDALAIEHVYAKMVAKDPQEEVALLEVLAKARAGFLVDLPKHRQLIESITTHVTRLNRPVPLGPLSFPRELNHEQKQALEMAAQNQLSIISGGPGTGKTFTAAAIIGALRLQTCVAAPTGKAASLLLSKLRQEAARGGTLHGLLGVKTPLDFTKSPETIDAQLILVDECSMVDPQIFARLFASIPKEARLVLMGDIHQLPAVEGGSVFADLIASDTIPTTTLKTCMRSDRKEILDLASLVLNGTERDIRTDDLGFSSGETEVIYQKLWKYVQKRDFRKFRILSTLRKGSLGVDALNRYLFEKFGSDRYPILITRSDSKRELSNGDTAMVEKGVATFQGGRSFPLCELSSYEYAYCISVHKAQGSEYDEVLFLIPDRSELFGKEVIYTAITRAKHSLAIDGNLDQIQKAMVHSTLKPSSIIEKLQDSFL